MDKKTIISTYFQCWLCQDRTGFEDIFSENVVYSECYGPEYNGLLQVNRWFDDWNQHGKVLVWEIKHIWQDGDTCIAEWYFSCEYMGAVAGFDGVTLARFGSDNKILMIQEFQSKAEHEFPYA